MKTKNSKMIDYPKIELTKESALTYIFDFYTALGWNGIDMLDPYEIKISTEQWHEICSKFTQLRGEFEHNLSYTWLNQGPSASNDVPFGKVVIGPKAFTEWEEEKVKSSEG